VSWLTYFGNEGYTLNAELDLVEEIVVATVMVEVVVIAAAVEVCVDVVREVAVYCRVNFDVNFGVAPIPRHAQYSMSCGKVRPPINCLLTTCASYFSCTMFRFPTIIVV
jgi:hypothetical protein